MLSGDVCYSGPMEYQVYGLSLKSDPSGTIRYVGQTSRPLRDRLRDHMNAHQKKVSSRYPVSRWVHKHGSDVEIRLLEKCETSEDLNKREIHWIEFLGTHVSRGLSGLNLSTGGGGNRGHRYARKPTEIGNSLTREQVKEIKRRIWRGESNKSISEDYPVNNRTIGSIAREDTWKHVEWPSDLGPRIVYDKNKDQSSKMQKALRDESGRVTPGWSDGTEA